MILSSDAGLHVCRVVKILPLNPTFTFVPPDSRKAGEWRDREGRDGERERESWNEKNKTDDNGTITVHNSSEMYERKPTPKLKSFLSWAEAYPACATSKLWEFFVLISRTNFKNMVFSFAPNVFLWPRYLLVLSEHCQHGRTWASSCVLMEHFLRWQLKANSMEPESDCKTPCVLCTTHLTFAKSNSNQHNIYLYIYMTVKEKNI